MTCILYGQKWPRYSHQILKFQKIKHLLQRTGYDHVIQFEQYEELLVLENE